MASSHTIHYIVYIKTYHIIIGHYHISKQQSATYYYVELNLFIFIFIFLNAIKKSLMIKVFARLHHHQRGESERATERQRLGWKAFVHAH